MRARIVKIGNSRGVRLPKLLLERSNLADEVELEAEDGQITIRAARQPRDGWTEAFRAMAEREDDKLVHGDTLIPTQWDEEEWEW